MFAVTCRWMFLCCSWFMVEVVGFTDAGFLSGNVGYESVEGVEFTGCVPVEDPDPNVIVPHAMNDDLLHHVVMVADVCVTVVILDRQSTHVCCGGDMSHKGSDGFVRLLHHLPEIH